MPRFLIERNFAEAIEVTKERTDRVRKINDEEGIRWLFSFLSPDKRKTYCLYEAPNSEAIRIAARRLNVPADVIIEVSEVSPEMFA
jgi:uncharacterized protein DUF4242